MGGIDRRVPFFLVFALVCLALVPFSDKGLRYVPVTVAVIYAVLALLFFADWLGRRPRA